MARSGEARDVQRIVSSKTKVQYMGHAVTRDHLIRALRQARTVVEFAVAVQQN